MKASQVLLVVAEAAWVMTFLASGVGATALDLLPGTGRGADCNNFVPTTSVPLGDGQLIFVEDVQAVHWVWATDPVTGEAGPRVVLTTIIGEGPKELVDITINGHTVPATAGHIRCG